MILVDSSVWIDFFNGRETAQVTRLVDLLDEAAAPVAIADLALFEVLRGFRHERDYVAADRVMRALDVVNIGGGDTCRAAAQHYRELRAHGIIVTSPVDILQAAYCIEHNHALLHNDRDFDAMESLRGLKVWRHDALSAG